MQKTVDFITSSVRFGKKDDHVDVLKKKRDYSINNSRGKEEGTDKKEHIIGKNQ